MSVLNDRRAVEIYMPHTNGSRENHNRTSMYVRAKKSFRRYFRLSCENVEIRTQSFVPEIQAEAVIVDFHSIF